MRIRSTLGALVLLGPLLATPLLAQEGYRLPPAEVVELVDAPVAPRVQPSPDGRWLAFLERRPLPTIAEVSRRMLRLAGMRIDPGSHGPYQVDAATRLLLRPLTDEQALPVLLPEGARILWTRWAHTGEALAVLLERGGPSELWIVDPTRPSAPRRLLEGLATVLAYPVWDAEGAGLFCTVRPTDLGPEPAAPEQPSGPSIQETSGSVSPLRTYQDLLATPHDEELFEHYAASRLVRVDWRSGEVRPLDLPVNLYAGLAPSPDGEWLLFSCYHRPFSYSMPWSSFPHHAIAVRLDGSARILVADLPPAENIPIEGVPTGPRMLQWKPLESATLVWAEALDGGDPRVVAEQRDRWMLLDLAAGGAPRELLRCEGRATGLSWLDRPELVLCEEYDRDRRWRRCLLHDLAAPVDRPRVLEDRSVRDRYGDPGRIVESEVGAGLTLARLVGNQLWRAGQGASERGPEPFLDRQDLESGASERVWRSDPELYESFVQFLPAAGEGAFLVRREGATQPPNWFLHRSDASEPEPLTRFADPQPSIRGIEKRLLSYQRADGVPLSGTLYLPADYQPGERLPLFVWAYPLEFNDAGTAGQVSANPRSFTELRGGSHLLLLTQGWAVLDGATIPIIGDPETMNDSFIEQLVASASAAIEAAVAEGVADRERVAVGGHSYGAFMTANLLAHCDLFRAGVARSGAYNRTLTPFGFQSERRTLWQAPATYAALSPFFHADRIDEPLLLVHGELDDNSGTFPMQSERLFQAIKGHGGTARLVILPGESHGYRARESVLHLQAETIDWLDRYVKQAPAREGADG